MNIKEVLSIKDYLKTIEIFKNLSESELDYLSSNSKERIYKKDHIIVSEGKKREFFYIVKKGTIKICKSSRDGRHITIRVASKNTIIGYSSVFKNKPTVATLMAIEDSTILVFTISDLEKLICSNHKFAIDMIESLSYDLENAIEKIMNLALDDTFTKVTRLISYLSKSYGIENEDILELDIALTRAELGSLIGTSRETVSRVLNQLAKEGILDVAGRHIKILKKDKLEEWL